MISQLPCELKIHVLSMVKKPNVLSLSQVNKDFLQLCVCGQVWRSFCLNRLVNLKTAHFLVKKAGPFAINADFSSCLLTVDFYLFAFKQFQQLKILNLSLCVECSLALKNLPLTLKKLNVSWCPIPPIQDWILNLLNLKELVVDGCKSITVINLDLDLLSVAYCPNFISSSGLVSCLRASYSSLTHICNSSSLQFLDLEGCISIPAFNFSELCCLRDLHTLILQDCNIHPDCIFLVAKSLPKLRFVSLSFLNVTNDCVSWMLQNLKLEYLNLDGCKRISDAGLEFITCKLKTLLLRDCNVSRILIDKIRSVYPDIVIRCTFDFIK